MQDKLDKKWKKWLPCIWVESLCVLRKKKHDDCYTSHRVWKSFIIPLLNKFGFPTEWKRSSNLLRINFFENVSGIAVDAVLSFRQIHTAAFRDSRPLKSLSWKIQEKKYLYRFIMPQCKYMTVVISVLSPNWHRKMTQHYDTVDGCGKINISFTYSQGLGVNCKCRSKDGLILSFVPEVWELKRTRDRKENLNNRGDTFI